MRLKIFIFLGVDIYKDGKFLNYFYIKENVIGIVRGGGQGDVVVEKESMDQLEYQVLFSGVGDVGSGYWFVLEIVFLFYLYLYIFEGTDVVNRWWIYGNGILFIFIQDEVICLG